MRLQDLPIKKVIDIHLESELFSDLIDIGVEPHAGDEWSWTPTSWVSDREISPRYRMSGKTFPMRNASLSSGCNDVVYLKNSSPSTKWVSGPAAWTTNGKRSSNIHFFMRLPFQLPVLLF